MGSALWDFLSGREKCPLLRTKHPTTLQKSQDGSATPSSLACQLAADGCRKLTWLPIPTPLPSQPHPFPKPPQRIKLQFAELVDDARHCPVRKGASNSMQTLSSSLCLLPELGVFVPLFSFGYSTMYSANLDQIIAHYPIQLVPNPLHYCNQ